MANQHVVRRGSDWAVRKEGASRDTSVFDKQSQAIKQATKIAGNQGGDVFIHNRHGQIRERNTYGKPDHYPPPG